MEKVMAGVVLMILLAGLSQRRRPRRHIPLMTSAILLDLAVVVYLEATRQVTEKVGAGMDGLLILHISAAASVLVLYAVMVGSGIAAYRRGRRSRGHRWLGPVCLGLRALTFITSFGIAGGA